MHGNSKHGTRKVTPEAAYAEIEHNAEVAHLLSADQVLYEAALELFDRQMAVYRLLMA